MKFLVALVRSFSGFEVLQKDAQKDLIKAVEASAYYRDVNTGDWMKNVQVCCFLPSILT